MKSFSNLLVIGNNIITNRFRLFNLKNPMLTVDMIRMTEKKMFFSSEKAKKELGYESERSLDEMLELTYLWWSTNRQ